MRRLFLCVVPLLLVLTFLTSTSIPTAHADAPANDRVLALFKQGLNMKPQNMGAIDADGAIMLADTYGFSSFALFVAEGRITLAPKSGSTTDFVGTFTDNFADGKVYPASLQTDGSTYYDFVINTHAGKFIINQSNGTYSSVVPKRFGSDVAVFTYSASHTQMSATYKATLGQQAYGYQSKVTGVLTIVYDSFDFVVPNNKKIGSTSGFAYAVNGKSFFSPITAMGVYLPVDVNSNNFGELDTFFKVGATNYGIRAKQQGNFAILDGYAFGGTGVNSSIMFFDAR